MKIALITDQHFGVRNDSSQFLDYYQKFYDNVFFPEIKKRKIKYVFDLGDSWDKRKSLTYTSLDRAEQMFYQPLDDMKGQFFSIVGNHNAPYKNTLKSNSCELLLSKYDSFKIVREPITLDIQGTLICFIPWICKDNAGRALEEIKGTKAKILLGHLEVTGGEMYRGSPCKEGISPKIFKKFEHVFSGHFHHKGMTGNVHYLGAPYEMTWQDYQDPRGFHIFDTETGELEHIVNPYHIHHKFEYENGCELPETLDDITNAYVKIIVKKKEDEVVFSQFLEKIESYVPFNIQIQDLTQVVTGSDDVQLDAQEDTPSMLRSYIDELEVQTDKEKVKDVMCKLYDEALFVQ